jgi:succinyl-diaminopimelate desuccinylase
MTKNTELMDVLALTKALIEKPSVTPADYGCQSLVRELFEKAGFHCEDLSSDGVQNLLAMHGEGPLQFLFVGHSDVVPPGPLSDWQSDPFVPTEKAGFLYGRGAADMKSGVAAMSLALIEFVKSHPKHAGRVGIALTSDEEGPAVAGVVKIVEFLKAQDLMPKYVLVGEASSDERAGDAIKIGRRGSMHGVITVQGKQGHIAYPQKADNPIHRCFAAFNALSNTVWDEGNAYFSPSSFQFYDIQSGVNAANVIPGSLTAKFNFRFAPPTTPELLQHKISQILNQHALNYQIEYDVSSLPYFSGECRLALACKSVIQTVLGIDAQFNTLGGTSDGRHFAPYGAEIIELGPVNKTIHKVNECTKISELYELQAVYQRLLVDLFMTPC